MKDALKLVILLMTSILGLSCTIGQETVYKDTRVKPLEPCSQYQACITGGSIQEDSDGACLATGAEKVALPCTTGSQVQVTSSPTSKVCTTAADCSIYSACIAGGSFSCVNGTCIAIKPDWASYPCWENVNPVTAIPTVTIATGGEYSLQCGGWYPGNSDHGCNRKFFKAPRVGPWITCSTNKAGSSIRVNQMRTYAGTSSEERLINSSNFTNDMNYWEANYRWSEWSTKNAQYPSGIQNPRKLPNDGKAYVFPSSDSDLVYHAGSLIPDPNKDRYTLHPAITLPGADRVRVEADITVKGSVTCMVGADIYTEENTHIDGWEVAESSWTGATCGQNITLSSRNDNGVCPVTPIDTPVTHTPVTPTPVTPTPTATCSIYWSQQPYNLTVGSKFTACFVPTSGCGTLFRVDLLSNSVAATNVITNSQGLVLNGSNYCVDFTAYSDKVGTGHYLWVSTMDGSPSSGSASSSTFSINSAVVSTPVVTSKWTYTWTLPSYSPALVKVDLHGSGDYRFPICTLYGNYYAGSTVICEVDSKQTPFTWSGSNTSKEVVWSSGYENLTLMDCHTNGSLRVTSNGVNYPVAVIPFENTCRTIL